MRDFCPDFFVLGAPKCGTTTVAQWLKEQDTVFIPSVKEPNYFNTDEISFASHSDDEYLKLYRPARKDQLLGDATPWYLSSEVAVNEITRRNHSAKFIVLVRQHVELACAMHQQEYVSGNEDCEDFYTAWNLQEKRKQGYQHPQNCYSAKRLQYLDACSLGKQLEYLTNVTSVRNILVISIEALAMRPGKVKNAIADHLGFTTSEVGKFTVVNSRKKWNSMYWVRLSRLVIYLKKKFGIKMSYGLIAKLGQKKIDRSGIDADFSCYLEMQFSADKVLLDNVLKNKLVTQYIN